MLAAIQTHPIQYHAPVYRALQQKFSVPVTAIYGSDFSVAGYRDAQFGATFSWDTDLLSGYSSVFLSRVATGGSQQFEDVKATGLAAALAELRPNAVLIGGYSPQFHRTAFLHAWRAGLPILFRAETTDLETGSPARRALRHTALRALYKRASRLLYIGAHSKRHYQQLGCNESRLTFSPYCVDTTAFETGEEARQQWRERTRQELGVNAHDCLLLFSGKLISKKRPDLLLDAVDDVASTTRRSITVVFLGDGELHSALELRSRSLNGARVLFTGFQNQKKLSPFYHAADLLVLPSDHSETWGLVVNEALAHGLPSVVSTAVGCGEDLVLPGQTGERFDAGAREGLAAAIERATMLIGRQDVREACRTQVAAYSVERAACGIAQAYHSVARA